MRPAFRLLCQMTARQMTVADLIERRMLRLAALPCVRTPIAKATAARPSGWRRYGSRNRRQSLPRLAESRHSPQQSFRVGMMGRVEKGLYHGLLDDLTAVHHDDPRCTVGDDPEVVRDQ